MTARSSPQYAATVRNGVNRRADDHRERYMARLQRRMEEADERWTEEVAERFRAIAASYEPAPWWKFW